MKTIIYSGGRSKPIELSGYESNIHSIKLKHRSKIKGKENSKTKYYYEVKLQKPFAFNEEMASTINVNKLFKKSEEENRKLLRKFLPALTTLENLLQAKIQHKLAHQ